MLSHFKKLKLLLTFSIALSTCAHGVPSRDTCFSTIVWKPCPDAPNIECASYQVPLDYANPEVGNATLAVARFKATNQPRLGTLLANPGGPGGSGVRLVQLAATLSLEFTNGQYDFVSWDPRGMNNSEPKVSCGFTTQADLDEFFKGSIFDVGFEARGNFTDQGDLDRFFANVNKTDGLLAEYGQRCAKANNFLKYMGTTAVVRDMVSISDCLEGPEKPVNYYGISYGTVIGTYFVNMFPKRVGRVILDGVVDIIAWATEPSFKLFDATQDSASLALTGFAEKCAEAGPGNCTIAQTNSSTASIFNAITQLIDTAYDLHKARKSNITSFDIRNFVLDFLAVPVGWDSILAPQLAAWRDILASESSNNTSAPLTSPRSQAVQSRQQGNVSFGGVDPVVQVRVAGDVIPCLDSIDQKHVTTKEVFDEVVRVTHEVCPQYPTSFNGPEVGEVLVTLIGAKCHRFPVRAVERFTGPFNHALSNPILVIGNTADPITPLANAQKIASTLGRSARLLKQDGFGHTSLAEHSDCTRGVIREYLVNGTLPTIGQVCPTDQGLFPPNVTDVLGGL